MKSRTARQSLLSSNNGFKIIIASLTLLIGIILLYNNIVSPRNFSHSEQYIEIATNLALTVFLVLGISLFGIGYGIYLLFFQVSKKDAKKTSFLTAPFDVWEKRTTVRIIADIVTEKKYRRIFLGILLGYAIFFSFTSQMIIFRPGLSFSHLYEVSIPFWRISVCCSNWPGFVPIFTAYILDNLILLLIPLNIILVAILSPLVALNITLILYRYQVYRQIMQKYSRSKRESISCAGGLGGTVTGLFTACPICAGTFFSVLVGLVTGTSTLSATTLAILTPYQALFISIAVPLLVASSLYIVKNLRKYGSCNQ